MAYLSGTQAKVAFEVQSAWNSTATVSTGDRILISSLSPDDGVTREANMDEVIADITRMVQTNGQAMAEIVAPLLYYGLPDAILALALGDVGGVTYTPKSLGAGRHRHYKEKRPTPDDAGTLVWSLLTSAEVREAPDCMPATVTLEWPENSEGTITVNLLTGTHTSSGTNGSTELNAATFPLTCSQVGVSKSVHLALQLWRKGSASAYVQVKDVAIEINPNLSEDNFTTQDSSGRTYTQPVRTGKATYTLTVTLPTVANDDTGQAWDADTTYHAILSATDARGANGVSKSGLNPSVDISGGTDTSIKVTLITGEAAQTATVSVVGLNSGAAIAAAFQTAIRALDPTNPAYNAAYDECTVTYSGAPPNDYYTITPGGHFGLISQPVVTDATSNNVADNLKLGVANGGTEQTGVYNALHFFMPELHFAEPPPVRTIDGIGRIQPQLVFTVTGCWVQASESLPTEFTAAGSSILEYNVTTPFEVVVINERATDML